MYFFFNFPTLMFSITYQVTVPISTDVNLPTSLFLKTLFKGLLYQLDKYYMSLLTVRSNKHSKITLWKKSIRLYVPQEQEYLSILFTGVYEALRTVPCV